MYGKLIKKAQNIEANNKIIKNKNINWVFLTSKKEDFGYIYFQPNNSQFNLLTHR